MWTVTSGYPEITVEDLLNFPQGSCLTSTNYFVPEGRAIYHPPLLIFPADLVVWMPSVFLFFMVATFLSLTSWPMEGKGYNLSVNLGLGVFLLAT